MYAIIKTGGKQYRVQPGDVVQVSKLDNALGSEFDIQEILMIGTGTATPAIVGAPTVSGAKVTVVVTKQARTRKLIVFKKKRRHGYRKFQTHRQDFTELFVKAITSPDGKMVKSENKPRVSDVAADRIKRIEEKVATRVSALEASIAGDSDVESKGIKKVKKAATTKKVAKKVAKKASGKVSKVAKKTKTVKKKTSKKA